MPKRKKILKVGRNSGLFFCEKILEGKESKKRFQSNALKNFAKQADFFVCGNG